MKRLVVGRDLALGSPAAGAVIVLSARGRGVRRMCPNFCRVRNGVELSQVWKDTGDWTRVTGHSWR